MASNPPISTVYVRNLEERVKPDAMKSALTAVFSEYGNIIDIVIKTNLKAKGQAFVVFDKPESAHHAIEETQGFELFEKPMQVALARTRSDATVKSTGNEQEFEQHQRRRLAEKERKKAAEAQEEQKRLKRPGAVPAAEANRPAKAARGPGLKPTGPAANAVVPDEYLPPNKILFVQNLPDDYDIEALTGIFGRFEGFREVRLVPGRKGIAFIEYEAEAGAITAKENTAGMALADGTKFMKVTYQRHLLVVFIVIIATTVIATTVTIAIFILSAQSTPQRPTPTRSPSSPYPAVEMHRQQALALSSPPRPPPRSTAGCTADSPSASSPGVPRPQGPPRVLRGPRRRGQCAVARPRRLRRRVDVPLQPLQRPAVQRRRHRAVDLVLVPRQPAEDRAVPLRVRRFAGQRLL
ncbi:hypothetical protein DL767_003780 [Monosporascus sp. MG133]|nr:hypothetical protein DL767_003780 [Monosporascus sp. MG133]